MADVRRIERQLKALEELAGDNLEGALGELHGDLTSRLLDLKRSAVEPTLHRVHDVPAPEGTLLERTFTGTFIGRLRRGDKE